jgi:hypothetical protein
MIHTIKKAIAIFLVVFGSALLYNCEPDADTLGTIILRWCCTGMKNLLMLLH